MRNVQILSLNRYNFSVLNLNQTCSITELYKLCLSENNIKFFYPSLLSCFENLKELYLSQNSLVSMSKKNWGFFFGNLFFPLASLRVLDLSFNSPTVIPRHISQKNKLLSVINLSRNNIPYINFDLENLEKLMFLDMSYNSILFFDDMTRNTLQRYFPIHGLTTIDIFGNSIFCQECKDYKSIELLLSTKLRFNRLYNDLLA